MEAFCIYSSEYPLPCHSLLLSPSFPPSISPTLPPSLPFSALPLLSFLTHPFFHSSSLPPPLLLTHPQASTGVIRTARDLDFDSGERSYSIVVIATDGGLVPQSASTSVQITITDVNDCTPTFEQASFTVFISENAEMGVCIRTLYVRNYVCTYVCMW